MTYNTKFYEQYNNYIHDPSVREAHDWVFNILRFENCFDYVLDLGCGVGEYKKFFKPRAYLGMDANYTGQNICEADYRNCDFRKSLGGYKPLSFVSLFSTEITASTEENYTLYEKLFRDLKLYGGLVSGFYYTDKKNDAIVQENAGLISYQTLESIDDFKSDYFTEKRIILPVKSKMFGDNVVEVWKLFKSQ